MSIAEVWFSQSPKWYPVVACLTVAMLLAFWGKQTWMGWYTLWIILGLPVFEIISYLTTKHTLSQNLESWGGASVRDYFLFWIWNTAMIMSMVLLGHHVRPD